ncbi:hypothetical protein H5410_048950 [Solanum commersonii]|uniref:Ubiquitin-like domain-containing protein n=1 Tax=Solanum commersonii TaxID=4109 RepID=A0A9J5XMG6_SOLCO|nr:hypothetical protein H5410_048950 [Solanum commersonii]
MSENKSPVDETTTIEIHVQSQDGSIIIFNVSPDTITKKIFKIYCKKKQMDYKTVRFLFDGKRVSPAKTIDENGLKNGDEIVAVLHQDGGGFTN